MTCPTCGSRRYKGGLAIVGEQGPEMVTLPGKPPDAGAMAFVITMGPLDSSSVAAAIERAFARDPDSRD